MALAAKEARSLAFLTALFNCERNWQSDGSPPIGVTGRCNFSLRISIHFMSLLSHLLEVLEMSISLRALMLAASLLFFAALPLRAAEYSKATDIIRAEGQFLTTDGSSYFLFNGDGTFDSGPLSMSGREIHGKWTAEDFQFVIEGKWGWMNGISSINDKRKLIITVQPPFVSEPIDAFKGFIPQKGKSQLRAYKCYFTIEELVKLTGKRTDAVRKHLEAFSLVQNFRK